MSALAEFRTKDFLEQIQILNELSMSDDVSAINDLLEMYSTPTGDFSLDAMIENALMSLLIKSEKHVCECLLSEEWRLRDLCIRAAGKGRFPEAGKVLIDMLMSTDDSNRLVEIISALSRMQFQGALDAVRKLMGSQDELVAARAMAFVGELKDTQSIEYLIKHIREAGSELHYENCDVTTIAAIEAVSTIGSDEAIAFLAASIHHRNPTARRSIAEALAKTGESALPALDALLATGTADERILAANCIGLIPGRNSADLLVQHMDAGNGGLSANLRYALYEALGRCGGMKAMVCLLDGLSDNDELVLRAIIMGLERLCNPGLVAKVAEMGADRVKDVAEAVIDVQALNLFEGMYGVEPFRVQFLELLGKAQPRQVKALRDRMLEMGGQAAQDAQSLPEDDGKTLPKALAVDDSKSMIMFHKGILSGMGFDVYTAENGNEALNMLRMLGEIDVIVTDMNMPVMDGMEFVGRLREDVFFRYAPVIMVTTESEQSQRKLATKTGVNAFLTKPFKAEDLTTAVQQVVKD